MKISKARLKQIIKEELEAVVNEEEETEESVEEGFISRDATAGPERRVPASVQRTRQRQAAERAAAGGSTLDRAAEALGMSPSQLMMDLAKEMGVPLEGDEDIPSEPPLEMPQGE